MTLIQDGQGSTLLQVEGFQKAARVCLYPNKVNGSWSIAASTGLLTGVAAGGAIFSLRNIAAKKLLITEISLSFLLTTAFGAAQRMEFLLNVLRNFTASDTGGTTINLVGDNCSLDGSLAAPTSIDCRISTTGALTAGTKSADANNIGQLALWAGALGATIPWAHGNLFEAQPNEYPLILDQNEGININNGVLMGATGVGIAYINVDFAEVESTYPLN